MPTDNISVLLEKIVALEATVISMTKILQSKKQMVLGEWLPEEEIIQLTGLSKGTIRNMRIEGKITSSTISGKANFYKASQFKKLLDANQNKK